MKRLIYILLGLLGFTSCEHFIGAVEYGTPNVSFSLKARVVDEAGVPIQGIEVRTEDGRYFDYNTGFSDYQGVISGFVHLHPSEIHNIVFEDVDGEYNGGVYETVTVNIREQLAGLNNKPDEWGFVGSDVVDLGDVVMTLK